LKAAHNNEETHVTTIRANLIAALLFLLAVAPVHASIVTNGSFETATVGSIPDGWNLTGFVGRTGSFLPDGTFGFPLQGDFALVFSSGNNPHTGIATQLLTTSPGSTYEVSFGLRQRGAAAATSPMRLFASTINVNDSSVLGAITAEDSRIIGASTPTSPPYLIFTFQFTATGTQTLLQFKDDLTIIAGDNADALLDRVQVQNLSDPSTVPEPASIAIFGMGALWVVGLARRRKST
jgi:hypothetical protein